MAAKPSPKVDLTLLEKLVGELKNSLNAADAAKGSPAVEGNDHEFIIEMSKAQGLAAGVMTEASLLILDIHYALGPSPAPDVKIDIDKILGPLKGGNTN